MKKLLDLMSEEFAKAFASCGYDGKYAKVSISNRPDLCEYQCNGAMAAAKEYKKAPFMIADEIVSYIKESGNTEMFSMIEMVKPGFINLVLSPAFLAGYAEQMAADAKLGYERSDATKRIVIDYGGPNVAKPLHVGYRRKPEADFPFCRRYRNCRCTSR